MVSGMSGIGKESRWKGCCGQAKLQGGGRGLVFFIFFICSGRFHPLIAVSASVVGWLLAYHRQCSVQRPLGVYLLR